GLSVEEAVALAKRVLIEGGHTSSENPLHQNSLRPRMVAIDGRAAKNPSDFTSRVLISTIGNIGIREGGLKREIYQCQTGYEYIWMHGPDGNHAPTLSPAQTESPLTSEIAESPKETKNEIVPAAANQDVAQENEIKSHTAKPDYRDTAPGQMEFFLR